MAEENSSGLPRPGAEADTQKDVWGTAPLPGALACAGEWKNKGKTISIAQHDQQLVLEMGPQAPTLILVPKHEGAEVWPMQWTATRTGNASEPIYFIELATPTSPRLQIRRNVGNEIAEFTRVGASGAEPSGRPDAVARRSRSRSGSPPRRSPPRGDGRDGGGFLPGDWSCEKCHFHNFARNHSCKSCGFSKPRGAAPVSNGQLSGRDSLIKRVKQGQRESVAFKQRWWDFCDKKGGGFYDPARQDSRFLEDFLRAEPRDGSSGSPSRSRSRSSSRSRSVSKRSSPSPSPRRSRSRHRQKKRKRRKSKQRHKHKKEHRARKAKKAKKRKRSPSVSSAASGSRSASATSEPGLPSRAAAIKATEAAIVEAEEVVAKAKEDAAKPPTSDVVRELEAKQQEDIERKVEAARQQGEEDLQRRLREATSKLEEEKAERLREAEQRLDQAIATRLRDAEARLRREAAASLEEVRQKASREVPSQAAEAAERRHKAEAGAKVAAAEAQLQQARDRLAALRGDVDQGKKSRKAARAPAKERPSSGSSSSRSSSSSSGSRSSGQA